MLVVATVIVAACVTVAIVVRMGIPIVGVVIGPSIAVAVVVVVARVTVAIPVVVCMGIAITIVVIVSSISVVIGTSESVRILSHCVPKFRMILQISLQLGMPLHVRFIVDQLRILTKLLGDFPMAVEELIKVNPLFVHALI